MTYVDHAHRHLPGGTDPIIIAAAGSGNRVVKYEIGGAQWKTSDLYTSYGSGSSGVVDPTVPFGGYWDFGNTDGRYLALGMPLGPQGSVWAITIAYRANSDCGKLVFDWQTAPVSVTVSGEEFVEGVSKPELVSSTWYLPNSGVTVDQDMYNPTPVDVMTTGKFSPIMVGGADGTMLSAVGTAGSANYGLTHRVMDAGGDGSVIWWLRVRINGKHASSSGYHSRIYWIAVRRVEGNNGLVLM